MWDCRRRPYIHSLGSRSRGIVGDASKRRDRLTWWQIEIILSRTPDRDSSDLRAVLKGALVILIRRAPGHQTWLAAYLENPEHHHWRPAARQCAVSSPQGAIPQRVKHHGCETARPMYQGLGENPKRLPSRDAASKAFAERGADRVLFFVTAPARL